MKNIIEAHFFIKDSEPYIKITYLKHSGSVMKTIEGPLSQIDDNTLLQIEKGISNIINNNLFDLDVFQNTLKQAFS